jgi:hypothetical protein
MKIAWNEITYQPKKFVLIEVLIATLMFMVVFLSGITNGLAASVSAQIANYGPLTYVLSTDSDGVIPYSSVTSDDIEALETAGMRNYASLVIQRATITQGDDSNTLDITYFATDHNDGNVLQPTLIDSDLAISELGDNDVILDSAFENEGIHVGDRVIDKISEQELTVVAFASRANYGYSDIGFVSSQTYAGMRTKTDPNYRWQAQTVVTSDEIAEDAIPAHLMTADRQQVIDKIPGYKAQNLTLKMITWVLLVASSAILGVFFYILTLQKLRQFGVMKAVGMPMRTITYIQISQLTIISIIGVAIGLGLAAAMAPFLPSTVPSIMTLADNVTVAISFVVTSILCGALSLLKIKKVDPIEVIGGNGE